MRKDGILHIEVPYETSYIANGNFQHNKYFNLLTFLIFAENTKDTSRTNEYGFNFRFRYIKQRLEFDKGFNLFNYLLEPLFNRFQKVYQQTSLRFLFPAKHLIVDFIK